MKTYRYIVLFFLMAFASVIHAVLISQIFTDPAKPIYVNSRVPRFFITQPANPTTGYSWVIESYDKQLLTLVRSSYQPPDVRLIGAGGHMIWLFQVTPKALQQPSTTQIKLVYQRSWDPQDNPTHVVFTVKTKM